MKKHFRLFLSSTFNDFRREREVLQAEVFPEIRLYCEKKGYNFQPIDLRWGINDEAQINQKTLELCINEVRICKTYPYPNFLIMIGDRYGWVPLPAVIEKKEFEALRLKLSKIEKDKLDEWYREDLNQHTTAYILQERKNKFIAPDQWSIIEADLRKILQTAVEKSDLAAATKRKYFLSATEAEIEEGIIPYLNPTPFQEKLLKTNPKLESIDPEHILGFFRFVDKKSRQSDIFIWDDYDKAQDLKKRVGQVLSENNIFSASTYQISQERLDEKYLEKFKTRVKEFLKAKIDEQLELNKDFTELEIEQQAQQQFANQKIKNFLGFSNLLQQIDLYIKDDDQRPLIIYGSSGCGKSALMAKAIEQTGEKENLKVVFRFIGATPNSTTTKQIIDSLFNELKSIKEQSNDKILTSMVSDLKVDIKLEHPQESFEQFSQRAEKKLLGIKDNTVIFIDAVDLLSNADNFMWLPTKLPPNLKIIISAIKDDAYPHASHSFQQLRSKTDNIINVSSYAHPVRLLHRLLNEEQRTLQNHQESYFLNKFKESSRTPLYVVAAANMIKHWKSDDIVEGQTPTTKNKARSLSSTNIGIINQYIENLHENFYHDRHFVEKLLGYLLASKEGLSESDLIKLVSADPQFILEIAPETHHDNITKELPLIIWSRLYTQIKPFLIQKSHNGIELLFPAHREFIQAINTLPKHRQEHEAAIQATEKIIIWYQTDNPSFNRWHIIYSAFATEYYLIYGDYEKFSEFSKFMASLGNEKLTMTGILLSLHKKGLNLIETSLLKEGICYLELLLLTTENLVLKDPESWFSYYVAASLELAVIYERIGRIEEAISLNTNCLDALKPLYMENQYDWENQYIRTLINLGVCQSLHEKLDTAIEYLNEAHELLRTLMKRNPSLGVRLPRIRGYNGIYKVFEEALEESNQMNLHWVQEWYADTLNGLAQIYQKKNHVEKAIKLYETALFYLEKFYQRDLHRWANDYTKTLNNIALIYKSHNQINSAIPFEEKRLKSLKDLYRSNAAAWIEDYCGALNNLAVSYKDCARIHDSIALGKECVDLLEPLYLKDPDNWVKDYTRALNNLAGFYGIERMVDEMLEIDKKNVKVLKKQFQSNKHEWKDLYLKALRNLADSYSWIDRKDKAICIQDEIDEIENRKKYSMKELKNLFKTIPKKS